MQEALTLFKVVRLQLQFYSLVEIKATLTIFKIISLGLHQRTRQEIRLKDSRLKMKIIYEVGNITGLIGVHTCIISCKFVG